MHFSFDSLFFFSLFQPNEFENVYDTNDINVHNLKRKKKYVFFHVVGLFLACVTARSARAFDAKQSCSNKSVILVLIYLFRNEMVFDLLNVISSLI